MSQGIEQDMYDSVIPNDTQEKGNHMTIFNDKTASPDEEKEMQQLKDGVAKAKTRLQEGREATPIEEPAPTPKKRGKKR